MVNRELSTWLASSANPEEVSRSVTGFLLGISSLVLWIAQVKGWTLVASDWSVIATQVGTAIGAIYTLYGLIMKAAIKLGSKPKQAPTV